MERKPIGGFLLGGKVKKKYKEEELFDTWGQLSIEIREIRSIVQNPLEYIDKEDLETSLEMLEKTFNIKIAEFQKEWEKIKELITSHIEKT